MESDLLNKIYIGIDTSFHKTGWAVMKGFNILDYGNIIPPKEFKKVKASDIEFSQFLLWYSKQIQKIVVDIFNKYHQIDYVVLEDLNVEFVRVAKAMIQVFSAARIGILMGYNFANISTIHNRTVKAMFEIPMGKQMSKYLKTHSGVKDRAKLEKLRPDKILMVDRINKMYNYNTELTYDDNDIADAIALCITKMIKLGSSNKCSTKKKKH